MAVDPKLVKWDDAPKESTVEARLVKWDSKPDSQVLERAGRVAGLGARAIATGVMGFPLLVGDAANQAYNLGSRALGGPERSSVMEGWNSFLTNAGLPEPSTPVERFSTAVTSGMAGAGGQLGAVRNAASPVRDILMQVPGKQVIAGGTAGAASQTAAEMGAGPVGQTVAGLAGGFAPFGKQIVRGMPSPEQLRTDEATKTLRNAGYRLPPTQAGGGVVNSAMETYVAGKAPTDRLLSIKNQETTNRLAKEELGFDKMKPLTYSNLEEYRRVASQPYRDVANLDYESVIGSGKTYTTAQAVKDLVETRRQANLNFKHYKVSQDPKALAKHEAGLARAEEIETFIEKAAKAQGREGLVDELRTARRKLAQSYEIEKALNDATGNVEASVLGAALDRKAPLSGNLLTIAKMANIYGAAARLPENVGSPPGRDVLGTYVGLGGLGGIAQGVNSGSALMTGAGVAAAALPLARPTARSLVTSNPYQAIMVNPSTPLSTPDALTLGILSGAR